jgi:GNAT superfamily N-acetyltransferase
MSNIVQRNYLEIKSIDGLLEVSKPNLNLNILLVDKPDYQLNKFLYKEIGKKHHWIDRLSWSEKQWVDYLNNQYVKTYILKENDNLIGYFEQIFYEAEKDCEIAYFGILKEYIGQRYGGYLLSEAIKTSFENGSKRVWVHTCSLDHKHALQNYKARGMKVFKSENLNIG